MLHSPNFMTLLPELIAFSPARPLELKRWKCLAATTWSKDETCPHGIETRADSSTWPLNIYSPAVDRELARQGFDEKTRLFEQAIRLRSKITQWLCPFMQFNKLLQQYSVIQKIGYNCNFFSISRRRPTFQPLPFDPPQNFSRKLSYHSSSPNIVFSVISQHLLVTLRERTKYICYWFGNRKKALQYGVFH